MPYKTPNQQSHPQSHQVKESVTMAKSTLNFLLAIITTTYTGAVETMFFTLGLRCLKLLEEKEVTYMLSNQTVEEQ